ncbi:MAG: exodeoxyribonuclease VII large subunit [Muribaculaceae bacterium]
MADNGNIAITLREFNNRIKRLLNNPAVCNCWIRADLSDVNVRGGHCYLELLEKDERTGATVAKMRGIIWANRFAYLRQKFLQVTGQEMRSGMKVMLEVSVNYHEQYGISLIITDIDPSYTLGDMERLRREILARLKAEGIIDMNKQLEFPAVPQRIAVVSAAGAAGYGDFMNQLHHNAYGLQFYTCLFPAVMQGKETVPSVTAALDRINRHIDLFDCVVIIRGGGSTSDLNSFDDYTLAAYVAQFPLPVVVGIGHERDITILDYVACRRVKTPTAAAELLIGCGVEALARIDELREAIVSTAREYISEAQHQVQYFTSTIPLIAGNIVERNRARLQHIMQIVPLTAQNRIAQGSERLNFFVKQMQQASAQAVMREKMRLTAIYEKVQILSPQNTLRRGYSLTTVNGHTVTDATQLAAGDTITTHLAKGTVTSTITKLL